MSVSLKVSNIGVGKALVLLHGWGVNSGVWQPLIECLKDDFSITTIDLPGYGQNSQQLPSPYNLETVANCVAKHLPADCVVIGWSLGGLIAQQIACAFPEKLKQLILICCSPKFSKSDDWPGIEPQILSLFLRQLDMSFSKTLARFLAIQAIGSESIKSDIKTIKQAIEQHPEPANSALVAGLNMLQQVDLREQLIKLRIPCYVFLGRLDTLVPHNLALCLQELAPQIKIEVLSKAAHAPFISDTKEFAKRLSDIVI